MRSLFIFCSILSPLRKLRSNYLNIGHVYPVMERLEKITTRLSIERSFFQNINYLSISPSGSDIEGSLEDYFQSLSSLSKFMHLRVNSKAMKAAAASDRILTLFATTPLFRMVELTRTECKMKIKDLNWHPVHPDILAVLFLDHITVYNISNNELNQICSLQLSHAIECRWNKRGNVLICTTNEELIAYEWQFNDEKTSNIDWSRFKKHELITCRSMKNITFYGNDNYIWTYSTPNLTIPNKETLVASKKHQNSLDDMIRPKEGSKPLGILDSLTNISSNLLLQAEEIQTESDEITKELPRIHLIRFDEAASRLYELHSIEHANITPHSMMDYNEQKRILLIGSKQKIDLFDCNNTENSPKYITTWDLPLTLLGLKCEKNQVILFLGEQQGSNNNNSFLSFDTSRKYTNLELWQIKLPIMEKPTTAPQEVIQLNVKNENSAILSAIQNLKLFVEDQFSRVNERLDRIEATLKINKQ